MTGEWRSLRREPALGPVEIGPDASIEPSVVLGYMTGRAVTDPTLVIGGGAVLRSGTVIYCATRIGDGFQTGHNVLVREQNTIGNAVSVWSNSVVDYGCTIGDGVRIHSNVYVAQYTVIEEEAFLAPGVTIANDPHPLCGECLKGPLIGARARLGVNCSILPRVVIGADSLIGSGAVVTKDIPPGSVVVGNPGRIIGLARDLKCTRGTKGWAYPYLRGE